jgi:hypothetical protein
MSTGACSRRQVGRSESEPCLDVDAGLKASPHWTICVRSRCWRWREPWDWSRSHPGATSVVHQTSCGSFSQNRCSPASVTVSPNRSRAGAPASLHRWCRLSTSPHSRLAPHAHRHHPQLGINSPRSFRAEPLGTTVRSYTPRHPKTHAYQAKHCQDHPRAETRAGGGRQYGAGR